MIPIHAPTVRPLSADLMQSDSAHTRTSTTTSPAASSTAASLSSTRWRSSRGPRLLTRSTSAPPFWAGALSSYVSTRRYVFTLSSLCRHVVSCPRFVLSSAHRLTPSLTLLLS